MKAPGCKLAPLGAKRASVSTSRTKASGTGVLRYARTERRSWTMDEKGSGAFTRKIIGAIHQDTKKPPHFDK